MNPAEYLFPITIEEATRALADWLGEARVIAGGTDLMLDLEKGKNCAAMFCQHGQD